MLVLSHVFSFNFSRNYRFGEWQFGRYTCGGRSIHYVTGVEIDAPVSLEMGILLSKGVGCRSLAIFRTFVLSIGIVQVMFY